MLLLAINVITICFLAGLMHLVLGKLIDDFPAIYSKFNTSTKPVSNLLLALVKASKQPLIILIWFFCSVTVVEILINKRLYFINSLKLFILIIVITWLLLRLLQQIEEYLVNFVYKGDNKDLRQHKTTIIAVWRLLKVLLIIFAILMIMQALHVDVTGIIAIGSAGTIVIGLAAKELLANLFGGMMIFMDQQFMVGDLIKAPKQGIEGVVEYIGWRLTRIRTLDKSLLYVPNSIFLTIGVENTAKRYNYRIKEVIRLKYQDLEKINLIIRDISIMLKNHPEVDNEQMCFVGLNEFNPMAADCLIWCFTSVIDFESYLVTKHQVLQQIHTIINSHGVEIAASSLLSSAT